MQASISPKDDKALPLSLLFLSVSSPHFGITWALIVLNTRKSAITGESFPLPVR
ncbi:uncharacterized protein TrAtP1_011588 [Trichoderma atroviride]|uniref:uncharacterized protein n=1 Tax=Hypocrea atroviridis TaxID=63577 RepID=UPI00331C3DDC|nr:hypothetical protein TrAtP1_011588 [Trichoderma atroviride]